MVHLGVNIDHVATIRQARYRGTDPAGTAGPPRDNPMAEPDPVRAAGEAEIGGADCITVHLREDRRHIVDRDVELLKQTVRVKLNMEMGATDEMVEIARRVRPHMVTLVPEGRQEVTTEGGLDVRAQSKRLKEIVERLKGEGIACSAFIDPEVPQVEASARAGFDYCEAHTGAYAVEFARQGGDVSRTTLGAELGRVAVAGGAIAGAGMRFNAGHGLNYVNAGRIANLPGVCELHIGHAIVGRAVFVGMREAVREMKEILVRARAQQDR